ncbi:HAD family hydrolase [Dyella sp.]|uniref:HAD family hydrolase n=1 Tax=Dyella sp. TaxID=1869338 RepID=UPI002ED10366
MKIRAVLFDLDGVLADYDRAGRIAHMAKSAGVSAETMQYAVYGSGIELAADSGTGYDPDTYLAAISRLAGAQVTREAWIEARRSVTFPRPWMLEWITGLVDQGIAVAMLTNNTLMFGQSVTQVAPALFPLFEGTAWTSAQFGTRKPFTDVYERCLAFWGQVPASTLFIDDLEENVIGAEQAGLIAHWYRDRAGFGAAMESLGIPLT